MIVHQIFAQILDEEVKNVIICDNYSTANYLARMIYGPTAFSVECTQYPCGIGSLYRNGVFFGVEEDGTEVPIPYVPTAEEEVIALKVESGNTANYNVDLDYRLSLIELGL